MKNNKKVLIAVLGIFGILLTTAGVTVAWFSYSKNGQKENSISSGSITFLYTEDSQGLILEDAMPKTDIEGKRQSEYFDFKVTSKVGEGMDIPYTVTAKADSNNTLPAEYVKVYLTDQSNNQIEQARTFSSLSNYTHGNINTTGEKILYEGIVPRNSSNYNKLFRLRMWMSDSIDMSPVNVINYYCGTEEVVLDSVEYNNCATEITTTTTQSYPYNEGTFKVKVNVYSEAIASSDSEAANKSNANILSMTIDGNNVTQIDETHYASEIAMTEDVDSIIKNITVTTANPNAQVIIEKIDAVGKVIKETAIKPVSVTSQLALTKGTNNFKIIVRAEDKSEPTTYYLTVNTFYQSFASDTWEEIIANVQAGNVAKYAPVSGGRSAQALREIDLGTAGKHYLRVANTTPCTDSEISKTACGFVIEFADVISGFTMYGSGYGKSVSTANLEDFNNRLTTSIYNRLPEILQNAIIDTTIITGDKKSSTGELQPSVDYYETQAKVYVLDSKEIGLPGLSTADNFTRTLDFYQINTGDANRIKGIKYGEEYICRSIISAGGGFTAISYRGALAGASLISSGYPIAVAFRIGPMPENIDS